MISSIAMISKNNPQQSAPITALEIPYPDGGIVELRPWNFSGAFQCLVGVPKFLSWIWTALLNSEHILAPDIVLLLFHIYAKDNAASTCHVACIEHPTLNWDVIELSCTPKMHVIFCAYDLAQHCIISFSKRPVPLKIYLETIRHSEQPWKWNEKCPPPILWKVLWAEQTQYQNSNWHCNLQTCGTMHLSRKW